MAPTLLVEILTPEATLWSGEATVLNARSREGEFAVMAQYAPTVGDLLAGVVRVETSDGEHPFVIHGGFFQVAPDGEDVTRATVLAGVAEPVASIDVARATEAKDRAESALSGRSDDDDDDVTTAARAALARAELRLSVTAASTR